MSALPETRTENRKLPIEIMVRAKVGFRHDDTNYQFRYPIFGSGSFQEFRKQKGDKATLGQVASALHDITRMRLSGADGLEREILEKTYDPFLKGEYFFGDTLALLTDGGMYIVDHPILDANGQPILDIKEIKRRLAESKTQDSKGGVTYSLDRTIRHPISFSVGAFFNCHAFPLSEQPGFIAITGSRSSTSKLSHAQDKGNYLLVTGEVERQPWWGKRPIWGDPAMLHFPKDSDERRYHPIKGLNTWVLPTLSFKPDARRYVGGDFVGCQDELYVICYENSLENTKGYSLILKK